ncbi:DNA cytosine methyltransferase [Sporolactobacillus shoreicorticis]|uniref:DNA (cytosine-5-)-methyltransferase n=1 Tax=Sporolactobacillus shoreicorticis TaxID=1923877 RepID=A0ABW5RYU5_9BACL|nr:DNA cytosine methyltransferase [Sporolactobacillus shoreicorticis]MCO7125137.1 DNA cytosine methyltransferase [Sporolactobacillus shoreicorticis]
MNVIDLFAGAGGLSEGFRQADFDIRAHVEMDRDACLTLKTREVYHYLNSINRLDIYERYLRNEITRDELYSQVPEEIIHKVINAEISDETIDDVFDKLDPLLNNEHVHLIIGGPPCQAYSLAGRSRDPENMENDPRNYLYRQYIRFIRRYQPDYFVFENVKGILSAKNGTIFADIQREMHESGYNIDYRILNAKDFGVLQNRKRVIIIGARFGIDFDYPDFDIEETHSTIRDLFSDLPNICSGESYDPRDGYAGQPNQYLIDCGIRVPDWNVLSQHESRPNQERDLKIYRRCVNVWNSEHRKVKYNELPEELQTHKNTETFLDRFNVVPYDDVSHTIVAHISKDGHYFIHPDINQNRSISIREAARVQSFPDTYYFESCRTAAFKQIGNAVPPLMAKIIAIWLKEQLNQIAIIH